MPAWGNRPTAGLLCPSRSTLASGQTRGAQGTSVLSSFLLERCTRLSPEQWQFARRGQAQHSINPSRLGSSGPRHWCQDPPFLGPFLSQSPGEARCPGQVTFSRAVARMPGNKSYPKAGNQCRARKPGLRGAGQMEGEQLYWGRADPPSVCSKCQSHRAHHLLQLLLPWKVLGVL